MGVCITQMEKTVIPIRKKARYRLCAATLLLMPTTALNSEVIPIQLCQHHHVPPLTNHDAGCSVVACSVPVDEQEFAFEIRFPAGSQVFTSAAFASYHVLV